MEKSGKRRSAMYIKRKGKQMKRVKKGTAGYIRYEKKRRFLITAAMFALPLGLYVIGFTVTKSRLNWLTFVAILGCLPACKSLVGLIMILMQKSVPEELLSQTKQAAGSLVSANELVFTAYEHNTPVDALVVCGNQVVCYTPDQKTDIAYIEKHISRILTVNGFSAAQVKVFKELKPYLQRVVHIRENQEKYREGIEFLPDERYPELSREELILHTLFAISL